METWEQIVLMRTWECSWWRWRTGLPGAACPSYWWVWAGRLWTVRIQPVPLQMKAKHHINKTKYMYTVLWPAVQLIDIGNEFSVSLSYVQWFKNHFLSLNFCRSDSWIDTYVISLMSLCVILPVCTFGTCTCRNQIIIFIKQIHV